ncbi:unnamed protein product, partial [Effrenium voratum]
AFPVFARHLPTFPDAAARPLRYEGTLLPYKSALLDGAPVWQAHCICKLLLVELEPAAGLSMFETWQSGLNLQDTVKKVNFYFWRCERCSTRQRCGQGLELCFRCTQ